MNKKIFNPRLYLEGLNQMKLMGFIMSLFTLLVTVIPPVSNIIDIIRLENSGVGFNKSEISSVVGIAPVMLAFMYLGAYMFSSFIFSFGNKRRASDFYDSLRNTRICTYLSFGLAALTWIVVIILMNNIAGLVLNSIAGDITFSAWEFLRFNLYEILVAVGIAGATFVAMSLTGTAFSNFMVMAIVLLLPRFIITFLQLIILDEAASLTFGSLGGILSPAHNLITGVFTSIIGYSFDYLLGNVFAYIYTFVLDLVYLGLAAVLFHFRKTETAEKSAPNKLMQHILRCGLTLPFGLFFGWSVYYVFKDGYIEDIVILLLLFALAAFIYFVYEAITTKSFKNLLKSLPLFGALMLVSVGTVYGGSFAARLMDRNIPKADRIAAVTIAENDYTMDYNGSYIENAVSRIKYDDPVLIEKIVRDLELNVESYEHESAQVVYTTEAVSKYEELDNMNPNSSSPVLVYSDWNNYIRFYYKNGLTAIRRVNFTDDTVAYLEELQSRTPEYVHARYALPKADNITVHLESLDFKEAKEVYCIYREEVQELSYDELGKLIQSGGGVSMNVTEDYGTGRGYSYFAINQSTPKALAKYMELADSKVKVEAFFGNLKFTPELRCDYIDLYLMNCRTMESSNFYFETAPEAGTVDAKVWEELTAIFVNGVERDPSDNAYTMYTLNGYMDVVADKDGEEHYESYEAYGSVVFLTQSELARITELLGEMGIVL